MEKYEPYLIGVTHSPDFVSGVLNSIIKLNPKSVGIEASPLSINEENAPFWGPLKAKLEQRGIKVVYLSTDAFHQRLMNEMFPPYASAFSMMADMHDPNRKLRQAVTQDKIQGKISALASYTLPKIMLHNAIKKKPDIVVCGAIHSPILRTNLNIPKTKFILLTEFPARVLQHEIRRVRRFETARKKKLPRVQKIRK